jgi:glycerate dehydrogenase
MKIVVLDGYAANPGDLSWDAFRAMGDFVVYDHLKVDDTAEIIRRVGDADAVIANKAEMSAAVFAVCPRLRYVGEIATGYNNIDVNAATAAGVTVTNVPNYGTASVAQSAIALLLEVCHHVGSHNQAVHEGAWEKSRDFCFWQYPLICLEGKTFGVIGFGHIGQAAGRIAQALGMRVLAAGSKPTEAGRAIGEYVSLETLLAGADVISLHCPLFPETRGLINRNTISKMKKDVIIINTARGPLINEDDLAEALNTGRVYAAGLDVLSIEPATQDNPLLHAKNCIITPHIAWASKDSRQRLVEVAGHNLAAFIAGHPQNVVTV